VPISRANLAVLVSVLISGDKAVNFRDRATDWRIIERNVAHDSLGVNNVSCAACVAAVAKKSAILDGNLAIHILKKRMFDLTKAPGLAGRLTPR
jgi:hypothetical protein